MKVLVQLKDDPKKTLTYEAPAHTVAGDFVLLPPFPWQRVGESNEGVVIATELGSSWQPQPMAPIRHINRIMGSARVCRYRFYSHLARKEKPCFLPEGHGGSHRYAT